MFLERLFYRIRHKKTDTINTEEFKDLIERSGFKFEPGEFENLVKWYFKNKEEITMEEFLGARLYTGPLVPPAHTSSQLIPRHHGCSFLSRA